MALNLRQLEEAEASYRQALDIYLEFGDRYRTARSYLNLGIVAQEQGRLDEAEANYRQALNIYLEFGDRHSAAGTYHNLGLVTQKQGRLEEAEANYRRALNTYLESDRQQASTTATELGLLAAEARGTPTRRRC